VVVLDELTRALIEKLTEGMLHFAGFVQARRLIEHKRSAERESVPGPLRNDVIGAHCVTT
jgi:hypothetical protein